MGPIFTREAVTVPRRLRFYVARGAYVGTLLILMSTAWLVLVGTQVIRNVGDLARFAAIVFQILAPLQLAVLTFFAALSAASAVALEKDRRTLDLLLLTNLSNSELVLGKLLASLVSALAMLAAAVPFFLLMTLFGGVSLGQVGRTFAVTLAAAVAAGSLGSTLALWREKTFQTLAMTALLLVFWLASGEIVSSGILGDAWGGVDSRTLGIAVSPWQAVLEATRPIVETDSANWLESPVNWFLASAALAILFLNGLALARVRIWNPSRETRLPDEEPTRESIWGAEYDLAHQAAETAEAEREKAGTGRDRTIEDLAAEAANKRRQHQSVTGLAEPSRRIRHREVWDNPVLWREIRTWAYGRKVIAIRFGYLLLFGLAAAAVFLLSSRPEGITREAAGVTLVPLFVVSLLLVNAQAVTALTSERDVKALDLLLVTDLTPKEFIFGKLIGILYNTKEMVLLPILLCGYLWWSRAVTLENLAYILGGLATMNFFVAMLGVHAGMSYGNSRSAIATSLGTVFFLFIGVATCIRVMIAFRGSFEFQLLPFTMMMAGGGVGLFVALGSRNPSSAIAIASFGCPFATFYAITSSLIEPPQTLGVFLIIAGMYGFTTAAMLIPALYEFDVATGRTTLAEE